MTTTARSLLRDGALISLGAAISFVVLLGLYHQQRSSSPDFEWLKKADPVADCRRAIADSDFRFIGTPAGALSSGLTFPGAEPFWKRERIDIYGSRRMDAPVFCIPGPNPDLDLAESYAERYNSLLRNHLEK